MTIYDELSWMNQPEAIRQQFYSIASKGDWNAVEAFTHLVPKEIRNDPEKVTAFMDGGTVQTTEFVFDRGRAGGHYETVEHDLPDRDVSRIEAGGEYSPENTIMEDASINRSRQAADMTAEEFSDTVADNAADVELLESGELLSEGAFEVSELAAEGAGSVATDLAIDALGPAAATFYVGRKVWKATEGCDTPTRIAGVGSAAAGTIAILRIPFIGPAVMTGIGAYALSSAVYKLGRLGYKHISAQFC